MSMFSKVLGRSSEIVKLPNHTLLFWLILTVLGGLVSAGAVTRLYELREFFPLRLPDRVSEVILNYVPFILGTFITTVAALAGLIVGVNWIIGGLREMSRLRIALRQPGDYYRPEDVSLSLKEGRVRTYDRSPSFIFFVLGRFWSNAKYISEISSESVRRNVRFLWKALVLAVLIHFSFKMLAFLPPYLEAVGLGTGYVIPSPAPFFNLLIMVCIFKLIIALSLIPLKKPPANREMDSMIVEGKGHPSVFFSMLEEGSKIFAYRGFPNRISRSKPVACDDGETLIGTLIESFTERIKTSSGLTAIFCLLLGSVMVLVGFMQIILTQYPTFSVGYEDFFRLYLLSLLMDIALNVCIILLGKGFMEQARALMSVYRFRSSLVYVEAKGDFEKKGLPDLTGVVSPERLFNPLSQCAFNVRYFSVEAISDAITPEGVRELVAFETSARLAKDVGRLKYLPFQVNFQERYPSAWVQSSESGPQDDHDNVFPHEEDSKESPGVNEEHVQPPVMARVNA